MSSGPDRRSAPPTVPGPTAPVCAIRVPAPRGRLACARAPGQITCITGPPPIPTSYAPWRPCGGPGPRRPPPAGSACPWARHRLARRPRLCANLRKVGPASLTPASPRPCGGPGPRPHTKEWRKEAVVPSRRRPRPAKRPVDARPAGSRPQVSGPRPQRRRSAGHTCVSLDSGLHRPHSRRLGHTRPLRRRLQPKEPKMTKATPRKPGAGARPMSLRCRCIA